MRAILQRVSSASVQVDSKITGQIKQGWLILLGVTHEDTPDIGNILVEKISNLRAFNDEQGKMNLDLKQVDGEVLVVSQFTLFGDCRKGRRPSFTNAAKPDLANELYGKFVAAFHSKGIKTETGQFAADMKVSLVNDGPVTFILDTDSL